MWVTTSLHGINEAWVALAALLLFLMTGILDKTRIKNIDWGFVLFFGVMNSFAEISVRLMGRWVIGIIDLCFSFSEINVLSPAMILLVYLARVFLRREATLALLMLSLTPWAQNMGIHPGVLLMTILVACEGWFLIYQDNSYLLTYYSVEEKAFSHAQARKLMVVKLISCFLVIAVSVPYWKLLEGSFAELKISRLRCKPHKVCKENNHGRTVAGRAQSKTNWIGFVFFTRNRGVWNSVVFPFPRQGESRSYWRALRVEPNLLSCAVTLIEALIKNQSRQVARRGKLGQKPKNKRRTIP
jgi:hypothetical protein